jgi:hypothetical protein
MPTHVLFKILTLIFSAAEIVGFAVPVPAITKAPDLASAALYMRQTDGGHICGYTSGDAGKSTTPIRFSKTPLLNKYILQQAQISAIPHTTAIGTHPSAPLAK